jgi:hypothetical protein
MNSKRPLMTRSRFTERSYEREMTSVNRARRVHNTSDVYKSEATAATSSVQRVPDETLKCLTRMRGGDRRRPATDRYAYMYEAGVGGECELRRRRAVMTSRQITSRTRSSVHVGLSGTVVVDRCRNADYKRQGFSGTLRNVAQTSAPYRSRLRQFRSREIARSSDYKRGLLPSTMDLSHDERSAFNGFGTPVRARMPNDSVRVPKSLADGPGMPGLVHIYLNTTSASEVIDSQAGAEAYANEPSRAAAPGGSKPRDASVSGIDCLWTEGQPSMRMPCETTDCFYDS